MNNPLHRSVSRATFCAILLALPLAAAGCQCGGRLGSVPMPFKDQHESGVAVIGKDYSFTANTTVSTGQPVLFTLKSNETVTYEGKTIHPDFRAYVKPPTGAMATDIHVNFSVPMIDIITGWAYLVGTSPMGQTTRVRAVGEGTRIIIEVDESVSPAVHRVYFVGEKTSQVRIYVPNTAAMPVYTMKEMGTYVEVYDAGVSPQWAFKGAYATVPARAAFVASVLKEITGAKVR